MKPAITTEQLRDFLDQMVHVTSSRPVAQSLLSLACVDEYLLQNDLVATEFARRYAFGQVVTGLIQDGVYSAQRAAGLETRYDLGNLTREEALKQLSLSMDMGGAELRAWLLLSLRYVWVELDLQHEELEQTLAVTPRTLRRYLSHGVDRLTKNLLTHEVNCRDLLRMRRLLADIPIAPGRVFIGRHTERRQLGEFVRAEAQTQILIHGKAGIGKTALVARWLSESDAIRDVHRVVWVSHPSSGFQIIKEIQHKLLGEDNDVALADYLLAHWVVVVLDGIDTLPQNDVAQIVHVLRYAFVIAVARSQTPFLNGQFDIVMELGGMSDKDAYSLLERLRIGHSGTQGLSPQQITQHAAGNPARIRMLARLHAGGLSLVGVDEIVGAMSETLSSESYQVWGALALQPDDPFAIETLSTVFTSLNFQATLDHLARLGLVEPTVNALGETTFIVPGGLAGLEGDIVQEANPQHVDAIFSDLDLAVEHGHSGAIRICTELLLSGAAHDLPTERLAIWCERSEQRLPLRMLSVFEDRLGIVSDARLALRLKLLAATCAQQHGLHDTARAHLEACIAISGVRGWFHLQSRAMFELAKLFRITGQYAPAGKVFERLIDNGTPEFAERAAIEQAQICIELGDGACAEEYLSHIDTTAHPRGLAMRIEAYIMNACYDEAYARAHTLLANDNDNGRLYALLGRIEAIRGNIAESYEYMTHAIHILEKRDDTVALGRTLTNYSALLIEYGEPGHARPFLLRARGHQRQNADHVGLLSTEHNLRLIDSSNPALT